MIEPDRIHEGMVVRSNEGKALGRVLLCEHEQFIVEKHRFGVTDYVARYEDVADVSGDEVLLSLGSDEVVRFERKDERPGPVPESYGDEGGGGRA